MSFVEPVVLEGRYVRLEPLSVEHAAGLARNAEMELFQHFASERPVTVDEEGLRRFIEAINGMPTVQAFAQVLQDTNEPIGATTYLDIRPPHRGLEVGMTWIVRPYQGTKVNPEAKLLLLQHAFEVLDCIRVQLKCDARNKQSQAAILKLGAKFEGCLRNHFILPDGYVRDTMMYSIIPEEWPAVKAGLQARLNEV